MDLTQVEQDVLRCLTESRTTASVVTLAADLWRTSNDWLAEDVMPLITWVLEGLSAKGLLTYIEQSMVDIADEGTTSERPVRVPMAVRIRLSAAGWALMGYPQTHGHVGHGSRHSRDNVKHLGDMTNYRNLPDRAPGDAIEVDDFPTHKANYPQHVHMYSDVQEGDIHMQTRTYNKVTPEVEASVIFARNELGTGASYADIGVMAGLPERTVRYVLVDLPRLRRMADGDEHQTMSLKERIVLTLTELPEIRDAKELARILGRADPLHDVVHVLHSLHTQGKVDFKEGPRGNTPEHIHLTNRGRGLAEKKAAKVNGQPVDADGFVDTTPDDPLNGMLAANLQPTAKRDTIDVTASGDTHLVAPTSVPDQSASEDSGSTGTDVSSPANAVGNVIQSPSASSRTSCPAVQARHRPGYPLLDALLERERHAWTRTARAWRMSTAAEAIEGIDPDMARDLMAKAEALNVPFPSPIEQEYITYVANHPISPIDTSG